MTTSRTADTDTGLALLRRLYAGIDDAVGRRSPMLAPVHASCRAVNGLLRQSGGGEAPADDVRRFLAAVYAGGQAVALRTRIAPGAIRIGLGIEAAEGAESLAGNELEQHLRGFFPGLRFAGDWRDDLEELPIEGAILSLPRRPPGYSGAYGIDWARLLNILSRDRVGLSVEARPIDPGTVDTWVQQAWDAQDYWHERARRTHSEQRQQGGSTQEMQRTHIGRTLWSMLKGGKVSDGASRQQMTSESLSAERLDAEAAALEQLFEDAAERLLQGRKTGLWQVRLRFRCADMATAKRVGGLLVGELSVQDRDAAPLRVELSERGFATDPGATPLTNDELAGLIGLPEHSVPGFSVAETPRLETNLPQSDGGRIGELLHLASTNGVVCGLSGDELVKHVLVTGITGSGKTHTVQTLLAGSGLPFMVLELAKREYRRLRLRDPQQWVFTPGDAGIAPFAINPLFILPGSSTIVHVDHLKPLFVAAFGLYGPMPQLLAEALERVYEAKGWDRVTGTHPLLEAVLDEAIDGDWGDPQFAHLFPVLPELCVEIERRVEAAGYQGDLLANIKAALLTRLRSLSIGAKGQIFVTHKPLPIEELLQRPVVFELEGLADDADKAFFTGLMLTYLAQWRQRHAPNRGLGRTVTGATHLLVIEEAHRFLRREGASRLGEMDANPREHAIEFFANMLSELRATGQGVVIAEQIPSKIIPDVIKKTATKIVHRLVAVDDQRALSTTLGLDEQESRYLNQLVTGEALIFKEGMGRAAKLRVDAGEPVQRLIDGKLRELMAPICADPTESRYGDMLGHDHELWGQLALRLLVSLLASDLDFDTVLTKVLADLPASRRQPGHAEVIKRLLQVYVNGLLSHGVFALDEAEPTECAAIYHLTIDLFGGSDRTQDDILRRWRDAITAGWGIPVRQQGVAQRVAGLILAFAAQHRDADRSPAALAQAVDQLLKVDAPAFKAQVVQLASKQMGEER